MRIIFLTLVASLLAAGRLSAAPRYILLSNHNVVQGEVSVEDDRVLISGEGSEWRLPQDQIAHTADSLAELYEWRSAQLTEDDVPGRIALADWCLRFKLPSRATELLGQVEGLAPRDSRVELLRRRITLAQRPASSTPTAPPRDGAAAVAQQIAIAAQVHGLPPRAVEDFTRRVQPILVNNCTTCGCHRPGGAQQLQLHRELLFGNSDQRTTRANLLSVLAAIDRKNPEASSLLAALRNPHAGSLTPRLDGRRQKLREEIEAWTILVAGQSPEAPTVVVKNILVDSAVQSASHAEPPLTSAEEVRIARDVEEWAAANEPKMHARPRYGVQLRPVKPANKKPPRDEFDPAEFNLR